MLIDTHAHIDVEDYKDDFDAVIERAHKNDVQKIIVPAVEPSTFERVIETAEKYDGLYACTGVHPEDAKIYDDGVHQKVLEFAKRDEVIAIGEIGLDYYWDKTYNDIQKKVFERQIEIAKEVKKPIVVHDREAHSDTFEILKRTKANDVGVIMHCFSGSAEFARQCVKEGFYIAIGGVVTFKNAKKMKEAAKVVPLERLLLETDSPYLTPEPHRGHRNEPAYVKFVAQEIASLRGISYEEVADATTKNALELFRIEGTH